MDRDDQLLKQLHVLLQGKIVGLQIDGGKTVSHRKVLGVGFTLQGTFYCWAVVECGQGDVWNEEFYCNLIKQIIRDIESYGAFVASVTADNEQTLSAGIAAVQLERPHLIHNRCFCHTCELLISDLQKQQDGQEPQSVAGLQAALLQHWLIFGSQLRRLCPICSLSLRCYWQRVQQKLR